MNVIGREIGRQLHNIQRILRWLIFLRRHTAIGQRFLAARRCHRLRHAGASIPLRHARRCGVPKLQQFHIPRAWKARLKGLVCPSGRLLAGSGEWTGWLITVATPRAT